MIRVVVGPLLGRFGRATIPPPGGDTIGRRRNDTHWHAFDALGAEMTLVDLVHELRAREAELADEILVRVERTFIGSAMGRSGARTLVNVHVLPPLRALGRLGVTQVSVSSAPG